jgi:DNA-binding HxlR family transcriptional regulator
MLVDAIRHFESQVGVFRILLYLYENRGRQSMVTEIMRGSGVNQAPMYRTLSLLLRYGVVTKERQRGFPPRSLYSLTKEGVDVAESVFRLKGKLEKLSITADA